MLKRLNILLLAILILSCSREQLTPEREESKFITGKILGYDGKPLELSHLIAKIYGNKMKELLIPTDKNGNFRIEYRKSDLKLSLMFTGVYHNSKSFEFYTMGLPKELELNVKLSPYVFFPEKEGLYVIGNFNNFSFTNNKIPMEIDDEGKYFAFLPNKSDTLFYQILGAIPHRSINGTMSHGYVYDGGGDYRSFIVSKDSIIKIVFDPDKLQKKAKKSVIKSNVNVMNELIGFEKVYYKILEDAFPIYQKTESVSDYVDFIGKKLLEYYKSHTKLQPNIKLELIQKIFYYTFGYQVPKEIFKYYLEQVPATSIIQKDFYLYIIYELVGSKDEKAKKYLVDLYENNVDENIRTDVLKELVRYYHQKKDKKNKMKFYNMLIEKYPNSKAAKYVIKDFSPDKKIEVGKMLPKFELKNLDNENEIINNEYLKGKYWLIDIWAIWCAPCIEEMKYLHDVYKRFGGNKFQIFSISFDARPEDVNEFRKGKWKMPWLNAFAKGAFDGEIGTKFEVMGIPSPILIDPNGKIIELEKLRGDLLKKTLEKYLK